MADRTHSLPPMLANTAFAGKQNNLNFRCDSKGIIQLPPLEIALDSRPRSMESAVRHTQNLPSMETFLHNVKKPRLSISRTQTPSSTSVKDLWKDIKEGHLDAPLTPLSPAPLPNHPNLQKFQQKDEQQQHLETPLKKVKETHSSSEDEICAYFSAVKTVITPPASTNDKKKRSFAFITHSKETFPTKEPKIDNVSLARRKRRRTSTNELNILKAEFERCSNPDKSKRMLLADRCNMSEKSVQIWFQNKRQALKRKRSNAGPNNASVVDELTIKSENINDNTDEMSSNIETSPLKNKSQALTFHIEANGKVLATKAPAESRSASRRNCGHNENESPIKNINGDWNGNLNIRLPLQPLDPNKV